MNPESRSQLFDLSEARYAIRGSIRKRFHIWPGECNVVRRVLNAETSSRKLRL